MAGTGSVEVTIDEEKVRERMRGFLAQAWEGSYKACSDDLKSLPALKDRSKNPYRQ